MKIVNVNGLTLQFDLEGDIELSPEVVRGQIVLINNILSEQCTWSQPQIVIPKEMEIEGVTLDG